MGLYRAARHYFRKEPKDLTLYEAALLAGMVQAPARLNPLKEATRARAHERAKLVLRLMVDQGRITDQQRRRAVQRGLRPGILPEFKIQAQAFTEWIVQTWGAKHVRVGETVRFFVTLDPRLQHVAERQLRDVVAQRSVPSDYDAAVVMMNGNGQVEAMVGSVDWSQTQFNNAAKAEVQPGSTAKLPLVLAACEAGRQPTSRVVDLPITPGWPSNGNVGYRGETSLEEAIAWSRNAAAVRLARELGPKAVAEVSRNLGIDPGSNPDAAFVLGTFSTNPLTMASAYATVANGGYGVSPEGMLVAVDGRGEIRANNLDRPRKRVISRRCVDHARHILREVVQSGTGRGAALRRGRAYGKTGTTTDNVDAWFIGWTENRVLGIWMGRRRGVEGSGAVAGSGPPAVLFSRIQQSAMEIDEQRRPQKDNTRTAEKNGEAGALVRSAPTVPRQSAQSQPTTTLQVPLPPTRPRDEGSGST